MYDWTLRAVDILRQERKSDQRAEEELAKSRQALHEAQKQIQDLKSHTEAHEKELLSKFCLLLNAKKDKIRELQSHGQEGTSRNASQGEHASKKARNVQGVTLKEEEDVASKSSNRPSASQEDRHSSSGENNDEQEALVSDDISEAQSSAGSSAEEDKQADTSDEDEEL